MEVSFLKTATSQAHYPKLDLPRIAFAGRSNVGKSSLINSLLGRKKLARTSSTPGRTQAINFFQVDNHWLFVDLPGYGYAKAPRQVKAAWGPMIEEFLSTDDRLKLTVLIVDSRHEPTKLDRIMKEYLVHYGVPFQVVATKCDKVSANQRHKSRSDIQKMLGVESVVSYSSATGIGKKELWQIIREV